MDNPTPPPTSLYTTLHDTAQSFISAQAQDPALQSRINFPALTALVTPDYTHTFGHTYFVSQAAHLQGSFTIAQFIAHLESMLPNLESWENNVTDLVVDEKQKKVVARVSYWMKVKGEEGRGVENDLLWVLEMDESGAKVRRSMEFVDGVAAGRIREIVMARKGMVA